MTERKTLIAEWIKGTTYSLEQGNYEPSVIYVKKNDVLIGIMTMYEIAELVEKQMAKEAKEKELAHN